MSEKNKFLNLGLLILCLLLGVGYATVIVVGVNLKGSATVKDTELRVDIESVVDSENIRGNSYVPDKMAGVKITYNKSENTREAILAGNILFHIAIAPYTPAQYIQTTLEFDPEMLEKALAGGEE